MDDGDEFGTRVLGKSCCHEYGIRLRRGQRLTDEQEVLLNEQLIQEESTKHYTLFIDVRLFS